MKIKNLVVILIVSACIGAHKDTRALESTEKANTKEAYNYHLVRIIEDKKDDNYRQILNEWVEVPNRLRKEILTEPVKEEKPTEFVQSIKKIYIFDSKNRWEYYPEYHKAIVTSRIERETIKIPTPILEENNRLFASMPKHIIPGIIEKINDNFALKFVEERSEKGRIIKTTTWHDLSSLLPIRIETQQYEDNGSVRFNIITTVEYNVSLPKDLFVLPSGTQVVSRLEKRPIPPKELRQGMSFLMELYYLTGPHKGLPEKLAEAEKHYRLGEKYYWADNSGNYEKVISEYLLALQYNPAHKYARSNLARRYYDMGMYEKAIEEDKILIDIYPDDADAHFDLGIDYKAAGMLDEAIIRFERAIQLKPKRDEFHSNLGHAYYMKNRFDEAIQCYEKAKDLGDKSATKKIEQIMHRKENYDTNY